MAAGRRAKPTDMGYARAPRDRAPIPVRGTMVSRCPESILGQGNFRTVQAQWRALFAEFTNI